MTDELVTDEQIRLVQTSWVQVVPIAATAADLFYGRLFELDDNLRAMFPSDLAQQKKKLMKTLGVAVSTLRKPDTLIPVLQGLGRAHADYGVEDHHYDTVGEALLWTLEQGLGEEFTPEVEAAWTEVYGLVATTMKDAAVDSAVGVEALAA